MGEGSADRRTLAEDWVVDVTMVRGDLPAELADELVAARAVAVDTETSGLSWREDELLLCQLYTQVTGPILVRTVDSPPANLGRVFSNEDVLKIYHHAPFDLRFIGSQWHVPITNLACTKAASKILDPDLPPREHSLARLIERNLRISLGKGAVRTSDWSSEVLSDAQISYAVSDVAHLHGLLAILVDRLNDVGRFRLWRQVCDYMPIDAQLEISGTPNPLTY